jgi:hypothetical protein
MSSDEQGREERRKQREQLKKEREEQRWLGRAVSAGVLIALITGVAFWSDRPAGSPSTTGDPEFDEARSVVSSIATELDREAGDGTPGAVAIPGGTTATATDPEGDFVAADLLMERGFSLFEESPPPGMDITSVTADYLDDLSVITVRFAGSYIDLESDGDRNVSIRPVFIVDGSYGFEIEYRNGDAYLSGAPDGAEMLFEWVLDTTIQFTLDGYDLESADQVRVNVFSRLATPDGDAVAEDQASLEVGR